MEGLRLLDTDHPATKIFVSMPRLVQMMRHETTLDQFRLRGTFVDVTGTTKLLCGVSNPGSLLRAVEEYVCR